MAATLQILGASYGLNDVTDGAESYINRNTTPESLSVTAENQNFGDSFYGQQKVLSVVYRYGIKGEASVAVAKEGELLSITEPQSTEEVSEESPNTSSPQLTVYGATYGPSDVTAKVRDMINHSAQTLTFTPDNSIFGDTWPGVIKVCTVVASYTGQTPFVRYVRDGYLFTLEYTPPPIEIGTNPEILGAAWGLANVTNRIAISADPETLSLQASNDTMDVDGWEGNMKSLVVVYKYIGHVPQIRIAREHGYLVLDPDQRSKYEPMYQEGRLTVFAAAYGLSDVTEKVVEQLAEGNTLDFVADNSLFGDSWQGMQKSFVMCYSTGTRDIQTLIVSEGDPVQLSM